MIRNFKVMKIAKSQGRSEASRTRTYDDRIMSSGL